MTSGHSLVRGWLPSMDQCANVQPDFCPDANLWHRTPRWLETYSRDARRIVNGPRCANRTGWEQSGLGADEFGQTGTNRATLYTNNACLLQLQHVDLQVWAQVAGTWHFNFTTPLDSVVIRIHKGTPEAQDLIQPKFCPANLARFQCSNRVSISTSRDYEMRLRATRAMPCPHDASWLAGR